MRCPLSGAAKAIAQINGAAMIIIGTEECTYYTKATLGMRMNTSNCHPFILDSRDVTFGCADRIAAMVDKVMSESKPKSLFLVTTCVVEITGEDYTAVALDAETKYGIPVRVVQTCHFKGKNDDHGWETVQKVAAPFAKVPNMGGNSVMKWIKGTLGMKRSRNIGDEHPSRSGRMARMANMTDEQILQRMKQKMGGSMSEEQMLQKIKMMRGGGIADEASQADLPAPSYRMGLLWTLLKESNDLILEYGTAGTTAYTMKTLMMRGVDSADRLFTTGLSENEVVMGDVTRLENAIKKLDEAYAPKRIYVLSSAVSEVTGADVKGVCNYMQKEVKAEIVPITGNGFGGSFDDGVAAARKYILP